MWPYRILYEKRDTNFNSHIPCEMWRRIYIKNSIQFHISIHTSRARCDCIRCLVEGRFISIHTSRAGCDEGITELHGRYTPFQFTHPVRDVIQWVKVTERVHLFQFTHPVRDVILFAVRVTYGYFISIHTSRAGCDCFAVGTVRFYFNSHIPCGMWRFRWVGMGRLG